MGNCDCSIASLNSELLDLSVFCVCPDRNRSVHVCRFRIKNPRHAKNRGKQNNDV